MPIFVGRAEALAALAGAYEVATVLPKGAPRRLPGLVLVEGEAGMGKTTLLGRFANEIAASGGRPVWGTCWSADQAPAFWPWTQALRALIEDDEDLGTSIEPALTAILPEIAGRAEPVTTDGDAARLRVFDAVGRLLGRAALRAPVVVILDDLQWGDRSTFDLLRYLSGLAVRGPLLLAGGYRPDEVNTDVRTTLAGLASVATPVALRGLAPEEVNELVAAVAGERAAQEWAPLVHQRSAGHPFFARELSHMLASGGGVAGVPAAVREVIARRRARVSAACGRVLEAASVAGPLLLPDVLAEVTGVEPTRIAGLIQEGTTAGLISGSDFAHDLYRESIYASLTSGQRLDLHARVGAALVNRYDRGGRVFPAELARHFAEAVQVSGSAPAITWAERAAAADIGRFAFAEAARHLGRARSAIADAGIDITAAELAGLLAAEADAHLRSGAAAAARVSLDEAWRLARGSGDVDVIGAVALGLDGLGSRFAMPRADLVAILAEARSALLDTGTATEAQITAALARQLQHSVPEDRPLARPLAERAVRIARALDDAATLAGSLLAHHDALWTPGTASERAGIAAEITRLAQRAGDHERYAQGLLLQATAELELGSPAFRAALARFEYVTAALRQPRHDYLLRTRQAALALLDGDIDQGEELSVAAAALGEDVGDTDTGNVRMSQRLEVVRARGDRAQLRQVAVDAVRWWVGAPAHAHAVAAGYLARAEDLDGARRELDTVLALPDWRTDRSYLWSIFVGEMITAAIAVEDAPLCAQLLEDVLPIADTCAVNGAVVCFMGAHAHRVGVLHAALGEPTEARRWLHRAQDTHRRLGAQAWSATSGAALDGLTGSRPGRPRTPPTSTDGGGPTLRRVGDMWQASYLGSTAYLRDAKGLHDLAALLRRPGVDMAAIDLAGVPPAASGPDGRDPVLDRAALAAYRRRLSELDDDLTAAEKNNDGALTSRASTERELVLGELRRATRPGGALRGLGSTAAERARKAVTARIRDAIRRIGQALPDLGAHLDRTVRTGYICRYDTDSSGH